MINTNDRYDNMFDSVAREFKARVELLDGSTLLQSFTHNGDLISFTVDRIGDNTKFFGFGICQKATVKLRDKNRAINIRKGMGLQISHGIDNDYLYTYPLFIVDEVSRNENTNELTIIGYDSIYKASAHHAKELNLPDDYNLKYIAAKCAQLLGMPIRFVNISEDLLLYECGPEYTNISGKETIREILDDIAEMLGCIYYLNNDWELTFKSYNSNSNSFEIDKSKYFTLTIKETKRLTNIASVNALNNTIYARTGYEGETQYLRDNVFLSKRSNADGEKRLKLILQNTYGITLNEFDCKHRGDFRIEIGDLVTFVLNDNTVYTTQLLCDTITYNGGLSGRIYRENGEAASMETEDKPITIGDLFQKTSAIIDQIENKITLEASRTDDISEQIGLLEINNNNILASVSQTQKNHEEYVEAMNGVINSITEQVSMAITPENLQIEVERTLEGGVSSVHTKTGFTFDSDGLNIHKDGAKMNTQITEDGMTVYREGTALLTADHRGVDAVNLSASTYLIVGDNSRFENMSGGDRTACFWIG